MLFSCARNGGAWRIAVAAALAVGYFLGPEDLLGNGLLVSISRNSLEGSSSLPSPRRGSIFTEPRPIADTLKRCTALNLVMFWLSLRRKRFE
jgi:hypothetical protein